LTQVIQIDEGKRYTFPDRHGRYHSGKQLTKQLTYALAGSSESG
jgi:hypothetical protein